MENLLLENISHDDLKKYIQEYYSYAKKHLNLSIDPILVLKRNQANADDFLGKTGYYDPENKLICLYITDRHAKDVLRSFAHELIHHEQNISGYNDNINLSATADPSYMLNDDKLKEAERDAFERGNMMFRTWTDTKKLRRKNMLNEKKQKKPVKKATTKGAKPDYLDFDKDGNKDESMKDALKQTKNVKKESQMKLKVRKAEDMKEVKGDDEEEDLASMMSKPKYKAGMSDFDRSSGLRSGPIDTSDELSSDELSGMEVMDDEEDSEELDLSPKRGARAKADPYDSATSFDRNWQEREKALRAKARSTVDDEPLMSDEELQALILKRQQEKDELQKEIDAYIAQLDDNDDEPTQMQENKINPYPKLFEQRERLLNEAFKTKEERVYNELIRRFIKK